MTRACPTLPSARPTLPAPIIAICIFGSCYTTSCLRRIRASPIPDVRPAQRGRGPRHAGPAPTRRSGGAADDTQAVQEARPTPEPKVRGLSAGAEWIRTSSSAPDRATVSRPCPRPGRAPVKRSGVIEHLPALGRETDLQVETDERPLTRE